MVCYVGEPTIPYYVGFIWEKRKGINIGKFFGHALD